MSPLLAPQQLLQIPAFRKPRLLSGLERSSLSSSSCRVSGLRSANRSASGVALDRSLEVHFGGLVRRRGSRAVAMAALPGLFPHPDSAALCAAEFFLAAGGPLQAYSEANGKNMSYSKFAGGDDGKKAMVSSRKGMLLFYSPASLFAGIFLAYRVGLLPLAPILESFGAYGAASLLGHAVDSSDIRLLLVSAALFIHFTKRVLEVCITHCSVTWQ
jgi:hypothetical protein